MSQSIAFTQTKTISKNQPILPISFWHSVALFGVPALVMIASIYLFLPWLRSLGISEIKSYLTAYIVPMALLLTAALVALYRVEGYSVTLNSISERFRYPRLGFKNLLWGLGVYIALMVGYGIFSQIGASLIANNVIPIPSGLSPWMDPRTSMIMQSSGSELQGDWGIAVLWLVMLFFNIAGEELWWRGYILPRQELTHGKRTWLVHGLMWTFFHVFKWWDLIGLLPVCLIIAYSAQRLKNNWPVLIAHTIFNGMAFVFILGKIMA